MESSAFPDVGNNCVLPLWGSAQKKYWCIWARQAYLFEAPRRQSSSSLRGEAEIQAHILTNQKAIGKNRRTP